MCSGTQAAAIDTVLVSDVSGDQPGQIGNPKQDTAGKQTRVVGGTASGPTRTARAFDCGHAERVSVSRLSSQMALDAAMVGASSASIGVFAEAIDAILADCGCP